jgi:hypothetical protein
VSNTDWLNLYGATTMNKKQVDSLNGKSIGMQCDSSYVIFKRAHTYIDNACIHTYIHTHIHTYIDLHTYIHTSYAYIHTYTHKRHSPIKIIEIAVLSILGLWRKSRTRRRGLITPKRVLAIIRVIRIAGRCDCATKATPKRIQSLTFQLRSRPASTGSSAIRRRPHRRRRTCSPQRSALGPHPWGLGCMLLLLLSHASVIERLRER